MSLINSMIHFRKTNSVAFAEEFKEFSDWLYKTNDDGEYINISQKNADSVVLSKTREKEYPTFQDVSTDSSLNNAYFLDDIKLIYYRGVPYDSATDYITTAEYSDDIETPQVDASSHVLLIPNPANINVNVNPDNLSVAYIHQLDDTGNYNANLKDASITVYVKGTTGKTFTIKQSMVAGATSDATDAISYWGLKNYIDSRLKNVDVEEIIDTEWKDEI